MGLAITKWTSASSSPPPCPPLSDHTRARHGRVGTGVGIYVAVSIDISWLSPSRREEPSLKMRAPMPALAFIADRSASATVLGAAPHRRGLGMANLPPPLTGSLARAPSPRMALCPSAPSRLLPPNPQPHATGVLVAAPGQSLQAFYVALPDDPRAGTALRIRAWQSS